MKYLSALVRLVLGLVILATPLLGVWLASSMAAMLNGPRWLAVLGGALLFPLGPLAWDAISSWLRARRERRRRATSSFIEDLAARSRGRMALGDRLFLRTLALNALFLGGLLWRSPETALTALTSRGDWMLDGVDAPWARAIRGQLLALADRADEAADLPSDNPYAELGETPPPAPPPAPPVAPIATNAPTEGTIHLDVPADAQVQVSSVVPPATLTGPGDLTLPLGKASLLVSLADGGLLSCEMTVTDGAVGALSAAGPAGFSLGGTPCQELQAPNPTWRPTIRLALGTMSVTGQAPQDAAALSAWLTSRGKLVDGQVVRWSTGEPRTLEWLSAPVVTPDQVQEVLNREPFLRVVLNQAGSDALCAATKGGGRLLALEVDGALRAEVRPYEAVCGGVLAVPTDPGISQEALNAAGAQLTGVVGGDSRLWEMRSAPLTAVVDVPATSEGSIAGVGTYIKATFPDEADRARAVHDYIAARVAYDADSLVTEDRAPQDADTVFRTHRGVCAGYANLFVALARAAGLEAVYLTGDSRDQDGEVRGMGHAWNAVRLAGAWQLVDVTWDAGSLRDNQFKAGFQTEYLFTPPEIFRLTHLPEVEGWQLAQPALSRGEFTRLPMLRPSFFAAGLALVSPRRSQVDSTGTLQLTVNNPRDQYLLASFYQGEAEAGTCEVTGRATLSVQCRFPGSGRYELRLFHNDEPYGDYDFGGRMLVNVR